MTSSSTLGICSVTLQFDLTRDVDGAARDVEALSTPHALTCPRTCPPTRFIEK